jgi:hypothetical protein
MQVVKCIVCSLVVGLILDQFVNLETQCIIAINSSIKSVSDVNNQDKLAAIIARPDLPPGFPLMLFAECFGWPERLPYSGQRETKAE